MYTDLQSMKNGKELGFTPGKYYSVKKQNNKRIGDLMNLAEICEILNDNNETITFTLYEPYKGIFSFSKFKKKKEPYLFDYFYSKERIDGFKRIAGIKD